MERATGRMIFASRWLQAPLDLGLVPVLAILGPAETEGLARSRLNVRHAHG